MISFNCLRGKMVYIFWTCRDRGEAKIIARLLLEKKLIACASLLAEVESLYRWKGEIEEAKEVKVLLKTQSQHFASICQVIVEQGSYEVPEISQVEVTQTLPSYLAWLKED
jgi:periplasmic divalent cation tolerance protein